VNVLLEIIFTVLVIADTVLTYRVIESGKGRETAFAKLYIKNMPLTIAITVAGAGDLMLLLAYAQCTWVLIFPIIAFGYAVWKAWRILHG
jgi:hypothetical protein